MPSAKQDARRHEAALVRNERKLEREIIAFFAALFLAMKESFKETGIPGARAEIQRAQPALKEILQNSYMRSGPDGIKLTADQLEEDNFSEEAALLALLVWAQAESQVASTQITNTTSSIMDDLIADQAASVEAGAEFPVEDIIDEMNKRNRNRSGTIGTTESGKGIGKGQSEAAEEIQRAPQPSTAPSATTLPGARPTTLPGTIPTPATLPGTGPRPSTGAPATATPAQVPQTFTFTIKKEWRSKRDFRVRGTHARADSRYRRSPIGINELFQVGSGFGLHPLASTLPAGEVIHCRCFARYVKIKQNLT